MSDFSFKNVKIAAIAGCVPAKIVRNAEYPDLFDEKEKVRFIKTTGIKERRFADALTTASDLAYMAIKQLVSDNNIELNEIKGLIFLSQTPDFKIPFTSNILQSRLGLGNDCFCMDVNAGCSGFISGLISGFSLLTNIDSGKVLFVVAETMSKIIARKDRSTSLIFGDGAAALLLEKTDDHNESFFVMYSDGSSANVINIHDGGCRNPITNTSLNDEIFDDGSIRNKLNLYMDGGAVFDFTMREVVASIESFLERRNIDKDKIDYFVFHQANHFIIKQFARQLNIMENKIPINIDRFGNTSGVSIPLTLITECKDKFSGRSRILCSGYGAGLSWGNALLEMNNVKISELVEYGE